MNSLLAELGIVCPRCDAYNAPKASECVRCRAVLGFDFAAPRPASAPASAARATPAPAPQPVAKPVTQPAPAQAKFRLVAVRGSVGVGSAFKLSGQSIPAGRSKGLLLFPNDPFVAPLHCTFFYRGDALFVRDEGGASGVFVSVTSEPLPPGSFFAIGDTLLRYVGPLAPATSAPVLHYGAPLPAAPLFVVEEILEGLRPARTLARGGPVVAVGQAGCELLITSDPLVAPRHCELTFGVQGATVRDLGSPGGTFLRIAPSTERALHHGDQVRLGNEILKVEAL